MDNFYCDILDQVGIFSSFITSLILFFKTTGSQRHANRLLSLVIFSWGWYVFIYLLAVWGVIRAYPHLLRVGCPLYYLIAPCAYMYVRSILFDESRFRKWDWLHFLPAALNLIELTPFYLEDTETKRKIVEAVSNNLSLLAHMGSGLIPAFWHFQLRALQGIIYLFFQWALLSRFFKSSRAQALRQFPSMKGWLISFSGLISLLCLGLIWQAVVLLVTNGSKALPQETNEPAIIFMSLSFVWLSCYLLFKPDILYGIIRVAPVGHRQQPAETTVAAVPDSPVAGLSVPAPLDPASSVSTPAVRGGPLALASALPAPSVKSPKPPIDEYQLQEYARQIGDTIVKKALFKKKGLTLSGLAEQLSIPTHHLSYMLRHFYRQQFNDFINQYRVNYVKEIMCTDAWMKMTLEAHGTDAGFSSRSTFFAVFKKQSGLTPTEYARQLSMEPSEAPNAAS